jgi:hypothetical protein
MVDFIKLFLLQKDPFMQQDIVISVRLVILLEENVLKKYCKIANHCYLFSFCLQYRDKLVIITLSLYCNKVKLWRTYYVNVK